MARTRIARIGIGARPIFIGIKLRCREDQIAFFLARF
jgi:hypothetical protein